MKHSTALPAAWISNLRVLTPHPPDTRLRARMPLEGRVAIVTGAGAPLGAYFPLTLPYPISITAATTTPQRRTYSSTVPSGRYEVRVRRTSNKDLGTRSGHDAVGQAALADWSVRGARCRTRRDAGPCSQDFVTKLKHLIPL